jgi:lysozyme
MNLALLEAELRRDEGVRYTKYIDSRGFPSCGVGHNLAASPLPAGWQFPLTDAQVDQLLAEDIAEATRQLDAHLYWWRTLSDVRMRVLANLAYNLGIAELLGFKKALAAVQEGAWDVAADEMQNSKWFGQVKDRAVRLCEAMRTDVMPDEPVIA